MSYSGSVTGPAVPDGLGGWNVPIVLVSTGATPSGTTFVVDSASPSLGLVNGTASGGSFTFGGIPAGTYPSYLPVGPGTAPGSFTCRYINDDDLSEAVFAASIGAVADSEAAPAGIYVELGLAVSSGAFVLDASLLDSAATLGADLGYEWTDVTDWVEGELSFSRGSESPQGPYLRYNGGRCNFTLDSNDGRFDPTNLAGPYVSAGVSQLRPGVPVRIVARSEDDETVLWVGTTDDWPIDYTGELTAYVPISASDPTETLTAADLPELASPVGSGETAAARVDRILDRIGWPVGQRDISPLASVTLQATSMAQPAWTQILLAADSAGAHVWLSRDGKVTVRHRFGFPAAAQATVGMTVGAIPYETVIPDRSPRSRVINSINLGRAGSTAQFLEDLDSIALNGRRSWGRTDLTTSNDEDVMSIASQIIGQFSRLQPWQPTKVDLSLDRHGATWGAALARDIGDRVEVRHVTPDGRTIVGTGIIAAVAWRCAPSQGVHRVTWGLFPVPTDFDPFILDTSLLDIDELALA